MKPYRILNFLYRILAKPLLFQADPEIIHQNVLKVLIKTNNSKLINKLISNLGTTKTNFNIQINNLKFKNPIGLAAGFDKNAQLINRISNFGFGFTEVGTITPEPQEGNDIPRLFRLPKDKAVINRMGFNSEGFDTVYNNILTNNKKIILGINIGKNKNTPIEKASEDYIKGLNKFSSLADYITINISSPNTKYLRLLQQEEYLDAFLTNISKYTNAKIPIFLKIDADLCQKEIEKIVDVSISNKICGIIATNTTISRENLVSESDLKFEYGGLSGKPLYNKSLQAVKTIYKKSHGKLIIIGVGGIFSVEDAWNMIISGASLVQLYTGMIYRGPFIASEICDGIDIRMKKLKINSWNDLVGSGINFKRI